MPDNFPGLLGLFQAVSKSNSYDVDYSSTLKPDPKVTDFGLVCFFGAMFVIAFGIVYMIKTF